MEDRQASNPINTNQIINAAFKLNDWLNFYWNFYVVFVCVVLGWTFSSKFTLEAPQKLVVVIFLFSFMVFSFVALKNTYTALDEISKILSNSKINNGSKENKFIDAILLKISQKTWKIELLAHFLGDALLLLCILNAFYGNLYISYIQAFLKQYSLIYL